MQKPKRKGIAHAEAAPENADAETAAPPRNGYGAAEELPLRHQRIVVTRARAQAAGLSRRLAELGGEVLEVPMIRFAPPTDPRPLAEALAGLGEYDWILFTSVNGVTVFFDHFFRAFQDLRDIGAVRIGAVGPATAAQVRELHLQVDLMPKDYAASGIVEAFRNYQSIENLRILLPRAEAANRELPQRLEAMGAIVDDVASYRTEPETDDPTGAAARLETGGADWLTFTSGSTVQQFHARFDLPDLLRRYPGLRIASLGPETSRVIDGFRTPVAVEADPHTIEGLVAALVVACRKRPPTSGT